MAAPCNVAGGTGMTCHEICLNVRHIGILHQILVSILTISPQSTCHYIYSSLFTEDGRNLRIIPLFCTSLRNFIQIRPPSAEKDDVMSIFKMADLNHLGFQGSNNGFFLKSPCTTSYRSSIETIAIKAVNCLVFEKIALFCILATDRQTMH